jgi:alkylation response protein AidB-like acyl-CoA dehydrogenase
MPIQTAKVHFIMNNTSAATLSDSPAGARPTNEEIVARAAALVPLLRANSEASEAQRRVVQESIDAIEAAGIYDITKPARFGGLETDVATLLRVLVELGRGDGSAAWATSLSSVITWTIGLLPDRAQQDIWGANTTVRACGVIPTTATATRVEGGQIISGKWGFASGSNHAQWAGNGVPIMNADGQQIDVGIAFMPMSDLTIEETWFVAGMRATGSNTLVANEVFVPDHRVLSLSQGLQGNYPTEHTDETLYRSAFMPISQLVLAAPQLGLAKQALELVLASLAKGRGLTYTNYNKSSLAPSTQIQIARASQLIDTAELHIFRAAADLDKANADGKPLDLRARTRVRADTGTAVLSCREAVDTLLNVNGTSSFSESSPLQRVWRDLGTGSRHAMVNPEIGFEVYGRAILGVEEQITDLL